MAVLNSLSAWSTTSDFRWMTHTSSRDLSLGTKVNPGRSVAKPRLVPCRLSSIDVEVRENDSKPKDSASKSRQGTFSQAATAGSGAAVVQEEGALQSGRLLSVVFSPDSQEVKQGLPAKDLTSQIKVGGLIDSGFVYREKFVIRCYEVGTNRTASMEAMANLLQECACNHAQSVGFSTDGFATTPAMRKRNLIWVTTRMHIEIDEYPVWGQVVEIDTWYQGEAKIATRRDWLIRQEDGRIIGRATSLWIMMNTVTRRLCRIPDEVRAEYMDYVPLPPRWAIPGKDAAAVRKVGALDEYEHVKSPLMARRSDLDMNQHVNNVTYMGWMVESMPKEIVETHELSRITIDYKRECKHDDAVESMTSPEPVTDNSSHKNETANGHADIAFGDTFQPRQFIHLLRLVNGGAEINRGRTEWRRKVARACS